MVAMGLVFLLLVIMIAWMADSGFDSSFDQTPKVKDSTSASKLSLVSDLRQEKKLVGLAAMVMVDGKVVAAVADGERKVGSGCCLRPAIPGIWEVSASPLRPR